ncbi:hypothetical protein Tco_1084353, partial [Tanacetum coccineum]
MRWGRVRLLLLDLLEVIKQTIGSSALWMPRSCQRAEEVGYDIRDVWVYLREAIEEVAPTTLEGVNTRVTKLAMDSLTATLIAQISSLHGQLSAALGQIQALQARDQTHADDLKGAASTANNMPPKRTYVATARAAAAAIAPMTIVAVEQLIEARVSAALANNETLRNSTNG